MDFLYYTKLGMVGVQRKEYGDLINSVMGDRVYRECWLMKQLDIGIWVIEGRPQWTSDGQLVSRQKWTVHQHLGVIFSLQSRGFWVASTESLTGTANLLTYLSTWLDKDSHSGLDVRPNPQSEFGVTTEKDWAIHLLQGFPMMGPKTASSLYTSLGLPLEFTCTLDQLKTVPGVGPKRAARWWRMLNGKSE